MADMPVLDGLIRYAREKNIAFHMPGHKNNINDFYELKLIQEYLYKIDCTEVPGLDNLHMPEEIISDGQKMAAQAYNACSSYFLVNGSTAGIYSMIMGLTRPKDKIIVQRNCHRSVFTACLLGELDAVYVNPVILKNFNIPVSMDFNEIKRVIDENTDAKALVLTYPTYYGTCCDLERITQYAHQRNMLVLVDQAHGAHLAFSDRLPKDALACGADAAVVSLHKSTPAMTQCALLNTNYTVDTSEIEFMLRVFQTTSPSYVLMASIDAARFIMQKKGSELLLELVENISDLSLRLKQLCGYELLDSTSEGSGSIYAFDTTKILLNSSIGGVELSKKLRRDYNIQVEMADINNVLLITSIGDNKNSFELLYKALGSINGQDILTHKAVDSLPMPGYKKVTDMRQAYYSKKRIVKLESAAGLVSAEMAAPYPPGVPVILPGEMITDEIIDYLGIIKRAGIPVNGLSDSECSSIYVLDA